MTLVSGVQPRRRRRSAGVGADSPAFKYPLGYSGEMRAFLSALAQWSTRQWLIAFISGIAIAILVALPTAVIPNPVFGRAIAVTWWSYPVVIITGILGGLLVGTYVRVPVGSTGASMGHSPGDDGAEPQPDAELDRPSKLGMAGGLLSFFAVGCPVCNKLVLVALGATGAVSWFAPLQPILAIASIVLMAYALRLRVRGQVACALPVTR